MKKPFFFPITKRAMTFVLSALFFNLVSGQTITSFIQPASVNIGSLTSAQAAEYQKIQNDSNFLNYQFVDLLNLSTEASDGKLDINVPGYGCGDLIFKSKMVRYTSENEYYWYGEVLPEEGDSCSCNSGYLMLIANNLEKHGIMEIDDDNFELFDIGGQVNVLAQEDSTVVNSRVCGNITSPAITGDDSIEERSGCNTIDVLVLFTPAANSVPGSNTSKAAKGIEHFNQVLANSHVNNFRANLVGTVGVSFLETSSAGADATALATGTAIFELSPGTRDVTQLRNDFAADIVIMMTNGNYNSSTTNGAAAAFGPSESMAAAIVEKDNITTMAHELGHLFGCRHETCNFVAELISSTALCDNTAGPDHPHFFRTGCKPFRQRRRTEMWSYPNGNGNRIPHYSNPDVEYQGTINKKATGTSSRNNAARMRNGACAVSAFRQSPNQAPFMVNIEGNTFVCPCKSTTLQATISGGANGAFQYEWRTSTNGISYSNIVSNNSSYSATAPCTVSDGSYVKVTAISSTGEETFDVFYIEAKDPPYPLVDCPMEYTGNNNNNISFVSIYPNPISGKTKITYTINESTQVSLSLFDYTGKKLEMIEEGWKDKGVYEKDFDMSNYHTSTYFVQLKTNKSIASKKITKLE